MRIWGRLKTNSWEWSSQETMMHTKSGSKRWRLTCRRQGYDPSDPKTSWPVLKAHSRDGWQAYLYLANSDRSRYGTLIQGHLQSQHSLGNNQHPLTIAAAHQVLSNHKIDKREEKPKNTKDNSRKESIEEQDPPQISFVQLEGKCYCCGKGGHKSPQCRHVSKHFGHIIFAPWCLGRLDCLREFPKLFLELISSYQFIPFLSR